MRFKPISRRHVGYHDPFQFKRVKTHNLLWFFPQVTIEKKIIVIAKIDTKKEFIVKQPTLRLDREYPSLVNLNLA
jgi:hypothetical protein